MKYVCSNTPLWTILYRVIQTYSSFERHKSPFNLFLFKKVVQRIKASTPPMAEDLAISVAVLMHSSLLRDEIHSESTVISIYSSHNNTGPTTHPLLYYRDVWATVSLRGAFQSGMIYVTYVGDSGKQANDCLSMTSLVIPHSTHDVVSSFKYPATFH